MNERNDSKSTDYPPNDSALVAGYGFSIRLDRWGVVATGVVVLAFILVFSSWATPVELENILRALGGL